MKDFSADIAEIKERLARIETLLRGNGGTGITSRLEDHERRLRKVERFMWATLALLGLWEGLLTWLVVEALKRLGGA